MENYSYAAEVYTKIGDIKALVDLHIGAKHWDDVGNFTFVSCLLYPASYLPNRSAIYRLPALIVNNLQMLICLNVWNNTKFWSYQTLCFNWLLI